MIAEEDYLPKVICRKCGIFVEKMFEFIQKCKSSQATLTQQYGMKRGTVTSPPYKQPAKRTCVVSESDDCKARRKLEVCQVRPENDESLSSTPSGTSPYTTQINLDVENASAPVQDVSVQTIVPRWPGKLNSPLEEAVGRSTSVYVSSYHTYVTTPLTSSQQAKLGRAIGTTMPSAVAHIITKECPSVEMAIKRNICNESNTSCATVCKRLSGSSMLYSSEERFEAMKNFNIDKVWLEMKTTQPFLIDLMNATTGNNVHIDKSLK